MPTPIETLSRVIVRPVIIASERREWDELMRTWHYLHSSRMVGEQLRYVAEVDGVWVALLGWSAATLKSAPRREWIGWDVVRERQRLPLIAQNARFLILPGVRVPHLASRILALNCRRLSQDWQESYGHPVWLAETFVDHARFRGTCYRAAGWEEIGQTKGMERQHKTWIRHGVVKRLLIKPLVKNVRKRLNAESLPTDGLSSLTPQEVRLSGDDGLLETLRHAVPDPRKRKGRRYRLATVLGLLVAGMLAGRTDVEHIAAWVRGLPERILLRFGCSRNARTGIVNAPCANAYRYLVQELDPVALDRAIRTWLTASGISTAGVVIAIDGKTLTGSASLGIDARKAVSFFLHEQGITLCQREVPAATTEVPLAREMIADPDVDLTGTVLTADAAHTCPATAQEAVKKGRITSWSSKETNPTWRLRWSHVSKRTRQRPTLPATITTAVTSSAP